MKSGVDFSQTGGKECKSGQVVELWTGERSLLLLFGVRIERAILLSLESLNFF